MKKEGPNHEKMRKEIVTFLREKFKGSHEVLTSHEPNQPQPKLPFLGRNSKDHEILYLPDIVVRKIENGPVTHIIEISDGTVITGEVRIKLALANLCLGTMKSIQKGTRPKVFFVSTKQLGDEERKSAEDRIKFMMEHLNLKDNIDEPEILRSECNPSAVVKELESKV